MWHYRYKIVYVILYPIFLGPQPYGNSSGKYVNENYQSRQNVYNQGSVRNYDYEPIPQSPPMVVQTGGLFNVSYCYLEQSFLNKKCKKCKA